MNTFKRKALFTAVVAGLGAAGTAEAVVLAPNNLGQVLVYPYYTVNTLAGASYNTYISVVNTTTRAKAVKVRVLEGKTSAEVLDFNLFLSPNDVWVAAIVPIDPASASAGGRLLTPDVSCTNPVIPATGADFRNFQYAAGDAALPGTGLDRTREGYIEIIEMGPLSGTWAAAVTHNSAGIPANCAVVQVAVATPPSIGTPGGGLAGTGTLINVNSGLDSGYRADALDAWSTVSQYSPPTAVLPNLAAATPAVSTVLRTGNQNTAAGFVGNSSQATIYLTTWAAISGVVAGARAVAAVYMHSGVINEYILDTNTLSNTDWVITQPLKNAFVTSTTVATPYSNLLTAAGACETVAFQFFNREERGAAAVGTDFSPTPPSAPSNTLCWESNVLSIRNPGAAHTTTPTTQSLVLGSFNVTNVNVTPGFQNGWAELTFNGVGASVNGMAGGAGNSANVGSDIALITLNAAAGTTFYGLPVTGFMVRTFRSNVPLACAAGSTQTCANAYSSLFNHSYRTRIAP